MGLFFRSSGPLFHEFENKKASKTLVGLFSGSVDLFFMSLKIRERVRPLRVFFSRAWKCDSELRSGGPLFHELENKRASKTHTGLFFRFGGPLFHELENKRELRPIRVFFQVQWTSLTFP